MTSKNPPSSAEKSRLVELFLISVLVLFFELACIRWFPAHVLLLTFFTNCVLLACFVGMSIGCLVAKHERNYVTWTLPILIFGILAAHGAELLPRIEKMIDVGDNSQVVYFGADARYSDPAKFVIPIEALCGLFFLVICLAMVGPGQELGRALDRVPDRVKAYTVNIAGSVAGIVLFAACSYLQAPPTVWFGVVAALLGWVLWREKKPTALAQRAMIAVPLLALVVLASWRQGSYGFDRNVKGTTFWSPYYRIDYSHEEHNITVNQIGHQRMEPMDRVPEYALPHMLWRDVQRITNAPQPKAFENVLVIGAGSGNDLSRALKWNVGHIDAVEIDPVIQKLGRADHPAKPYSDPRVTPYNDDGRNFLKSTDKKYDLVVYALVDSLVLHSSFSNIRLESYLFTKEAFDDVKKVLKPNGVFATYNYFRQGWVVARLEKTLEASFGTKPMAMMLPFREKVEPDQTFGSFTIFLSGSDEALGPYRKAFAEHPQYWLDAKNSEPTSERNGFTDTPQAGTNGDGIFPGQGAIPDDKRWVRFGVANIVQPADLKLATDDWPFLYLRAPLIPTLSIRAAVIMAGIGIGLLWLFDRKRPKEQKQSPFDWQMFFLGAGFMLVETKAVVRMALLFGSTWMVNTIVFFAVLVIILLANMLVLRFRPKKLALWHVGLVASLLVGVFVPLDIFLGMSRLPQVVFSSLLVVAPIFFAGVVFSVSFAKVREPDRAFGANIAGAMLGGLAEYASMLVGFQHVGYLAVALYLASMFFAWKRANNEGAPAESTNESRSEGESAPA